MLRDGSPRPETKVVTLDGKRYNVITRDDQVTGIGPRAWTEQIVTSQDVEPQETAMRLLSFHEGSGFSYDGMPNTYAYANGWDAASWLASFRIASASSETHGSARSDTNVPA